MLSFHSVEAQYNKLFIPDTLSGKTFYLNLTDTFKQFLPGQQTITEGINGNWWGPTLIFQKGDTVQLTVRNKLNDTTAIHWHGIVMPAIMNGGPHKLMTPGAVWKPFWKVLNNAATYYYEPNRFMMVKKQLNMGVGGFIIVRDNEESKLQLPRKYGVDDIPLQITERSFDQYNQIITTADYGDTILINGTLNPTLDAPAQWIRLRLLNAGPSRDYNIGVSDSSDFFVIASDGGLLDSAIGMKKLLIAPGERYEILLNLSSARGKSLKLMAYNNAIRSIATIQQSVNKLDNRDFVLLTINVIAPLSNKLNTVPIKLVNTHKPDTLKVSATKKIHIHSGGKGKHYFDAAQRIFNPSKINRYSKMDSTEIWDIRNSSKIAQTFHIHNVQFQLVSRNGQSPPTWERGWKDVLNTRGDTSVKFLIKFAYYSDTLVPYYYHSTIAKYRDEGLMGQFLVVPNYYHIPTIESRIKGKHSSIVSYTDSMQARLFFTPAAGIVIYYADIIGEFDNTVLKAPMPHPASGIDISGLSQGEYLLILKDTRNQIYTSRFIKN